jgi:outer membrane protein assembly factor BamD
MASVWVIEKGGSMIRRVTLALLPLVLANWTRPSDTIHRSSDTAEVAEMAVDASDQAAEREMIIGRHYMSKFDYTAALNRFKTVVTRYPASPLVEEALTRLAEIYLALPSDVRTRENVWNRESIAALQSEAQTAVATLDRKFPTSHFSIEAHDALKSAKLDPVENERSWISRALK